MSIAVSEGVFLKKVGRQGTGTIPDAAWKGANDGPSEPPLDEIQKPLAEPVKTLTLNFDDS